MARQKQEKTNQARQKQAPKLVSAVHPQPKIIVAQGPGEGKGFQKPSSCPVKTELEVFKKNVQRSVKEYRTLKQYEDSLQNPTGRAARGKKIYPPDENFFRNTGCHVNRSPSHFADGLQKRKTRQDRNGKIQPIGAVRKTTFKFPTRTVQPASERPKYSWTTHTSSLDRTSSTPGGHVSTANTVLR